MDGAHVDREATVIGSLVGPHARVHPHHRVIGQIIGEHGEA
jgi:hypothetical protein